MAYRATILACLALAIVLVQGCGSPPVQSTRGLNNDDTEISDDVTSGKTVHNEVPDPAYDKTYGWFPYVAGTTTGQVILWPWNRVLDVLDIVRLNVGIGPCAGLNVRLTEYWSIGAETTNTVHFGLPGSNRDGMQIFLEKPWFWKEKMEYYWNISIYSEGFKPTYKRKAGEIGGTVRGFAGTIDAAIDFWALADFITGIVLVDLELDDDQWSLFPSSYDDEEIKEVETEETGGTTAPPPVVED